MTDSIQASDGLTDAEYIRRIADGFINRHDEVSRAHVHRLHAIAVRLSNPPAVPKLPSDPACYAGFVMDYLAYAPFMKNHKLFCTWRGERYRVTGCSRMGDIWLARNHEQESGYDYRADVAECSEWSATSSAPIKE